MATRTRKSGNPIIREINYMKDEAAELSYEGNYAAAQGRKGDAARYFARLKEVFKKADRPEFAAEDARDSIQRVAAKARKEGIIYGRRHASLARRRRVTDKRDKRKHADMLKSLHRHKTLIGH